MFSGVRANMPTFVCLVLSLFFTASTSGETITIAAASDLKAAMDQIAADFGAANPAQAIDVIYGSSGKFLTQIQQGAPYDLFFSADIDYPKQLVDRGLAIASVTAYAVGRLVLWHAQKERPELTREFLLNPRITHIAIANPVHAPYGKRAQEALRALGLWESLEPKLVLGENIAQTAQFVASGNAQIGFIALSLALSPELATRGSYVIVPDHLHEPLEQAFVITKRAANNALAKQFAQYMNSPQARGVMCRYGFVLPGDADITP